MAESILSISALGNDVGGIGTGDDGRRVFVRGALPEETVRCRITKEKKSFLQARLLEVVIPSPHRTEAFCSHYGECGGCSLQHLSYGRQLFWKGQWIRRALKRGGIPFPGPVDVIPSPEEREYRNRVSFDILQGIPGLHRYHGDVMPIDDCPLLNSPGRDIYRSLMGMLPLNAGRVSVRSSVQTGESMVEFSGGQGVRCIALEGVTVTAWKTGKQWRREPAEAVFHEEVGAIVHRVLPGAFFQVNTGCANLLLSAVVKAVEPESRILDLYGGSGAFSLPLARSAARVTSVELSADSSEGGIETARSAGIENVEFVNCRVRRFLTDTVDAEDQWDTVVLDPPRAGLGIRVARLLRRVRTDRIVYVSCNPFSLARDLGVLQDGGWTVARVTGYDMFPQTDHVETLVILERDGER